MSEPAGEDTINARHAEKMRKHKAARDKIMATKSGDKGLLIVNTGSGKGKTSAALGMVFRHRRGEAAGALSRPRHFAHHGRGIHLGDAGP